MKDFISRFLLLSSLPIIVPIKIILVVAFGIPVVIWAANRFLDSVLCKIFREF